MNELMETRQVTLQDNNIIRDKNGDLIGMLSSYDVINNESQNAPHGNPQAMAWANYFVEIANDNDLIISDKNGVLTEKQVKELMLGWFANVMMAMHDYLYNSKKIGQ